MPADLRKALSAAPEAKARWNDLTALARWDYILWIDEAKQEQTRARRIERACSMLVDGKRRPCCFSVVPLDLHQALQAAPKAKRGWNTLSSIERRNFISWIASADDKAVRKKRIDELCVMLAKGTHAER